MRPTDGCSFATMAPEHIPFVTSSWRGSGMGQTTLKRVITRPDARAVVAHVSGYPDQYIGWAASLRGVLVYVYVRGFLRKNGFGGLLIASVVPNAVPIHVACWTPMIQKLAEHGYPVQYEPKTRALLEKLR